MFGKFVCGAVCLGGVMIADPVSAMTLDVTQQNLGNIFADSAGDNDLSADGTFSFDSNGDGDFTDQGDEDELTFAGGLFRLVESSTGQADRDFVAFCFEYTQFIDLPNSYMSDIFSNPALAASLDALYTNAYAGIFEAPADANEPTQAEKAAAFQFVLWEISIDPVLDLSDGRLRLDGAETTRLFDLTSDIIANLNSGAWVGDGRFTLELLQSDLSQNLIRASAGPADVPVPAPAWLLASALAGLGWARWRGAKR